MNDITANGPTWGLLTHVCAPDILTIEASTISANRSHTINVKYSFFECMDRSIGMRDVGFFFLKLGACVLVCLCVLLSCAFVTRPSVSQSHGQGLVIGHAWPW